MSSSFHLIDWIIVGAYLAAMGGVGVYFSRRQTTLQHFLLADKRMGWLPVGLSLMAALNSGMDYLMQPSSTIRYGAVLVLGILSWLPLYPWVAHVAFPFFQRLNFFTVYEYLEARFDLRVRTLAAVIFILWRLGWMATAMYVPSLAINAASGGQVDLVTMTIIVGVLVTSYTMLGGIEAVIWNDVIQFCIMFGGLAATVGIVWWSVPGGFGEIWSVSEAAGKLDVWVPLGDPAAVGVIAQIVAFFQQPMNLIALMVALIVGRMAQYTSDQVMVQRLQSTRSLQEARQAFVVNAAGDALWMLGLSFVGFALFAYFRPARSAWWWRRSWRPRCRASTRRSTRARRSSWSISTTALARAATSGRARAAGRTKRARFACRGSRRSSSAPSARSWRAMSRALDRCWKSTRRLSTRSRDRCLEFFCWRCSSRGYGAPPR
jgi:SSS family solute:Na+ symporter